MPLGVGGRVALRCRLAVDERAFDLYSVHFQHGGMAGDSRVVAAERLLGAIAARASVPAVVAGDLNCRPGSRELDLLLGPLRSAHVVVHGLEPESTVMPVSRGFVLDYILVSEGVEVVDARVAFDEAGPAGLTASDHLGLVARVRLVG